jgi:hypothetical protein
MGETVFLSGSRKLSRLNDRIRARLDNVLAHGLRVVVGDANGADKALQSYLAEKQYPTVTIFCAQGRCRNNVGGWEERAVPVPEGLTGRDFYTVKDLAMAQEADYGLVLWDGKSLGSINNVLALLKRGKTVVVYVSPRQAFATLKNAMDVEMLIGECDPEDREEILRKTGFGRKLRELQAAGQAALEFG